MAGEKINEAESCIFRINNRLLAKPTKKKHKQNANKQLEMTEETLQLTPYTNTKGHQGPL